MYVEAKIGGIAQLGERLHGMQEVSGSIPLTSTNRLAGCQQRVVEEEDKILTLSSRGLGHDPFTVVTGVRIPVGSPAKAGTSCRQRLERKFEVADHVEW